MYQILSAYLAYHGQKYIRPDKAGGAAMEMLHFKEKGQQARKAFQDFMRDVSSLLPDFQPEKVSLWANQAQMARPHFWCYFRQPSDEKSWVALAFRLYGNSKSFGISCEVSFVVRSQTEYTAALQARILELPAPSETYYLVDGTRRLEANEYNRQLLREELAQGQVKKVLLKQDIPIINQTREELVNQLVISFKRLQAYYDWANQEVKSIID